MSPLQLWINGMATLSDSNVVDMFETVSFLIIR